MPLHMFPFESYIYFTAEDYNKYIKIIIDIGNIRAVSDSTLSHNC